MADAASTSLAPYDGAIQAVFKPIDRLTAMLERRGEPARIIKEAEARAAARRIEAATNHEIMLEETKAEIRRARLQLIGNELLEELELKFTRRELVREEAERILQDQATKTENVDQPAKALPCSAAAPTGTTSQDWVNSFLGVAENISEEQLRTLLARLLAGEATNPGSFSRRVISTLRDIETPELKTFEKVCPLVWLIEPPTPGAFMPGSVADHFPALLTTDDVLKLEDIGLINRGTGGGRDTA